MTFDAKKGFTGLATGVAELGAPEGALRDAKNVVVRKFGAVENRQAFPPLNWGDVGVDPAGHLLVNSAPYAGGTMFETAAGWIDNNDSSILQWDRPESGMYTPIKRRLDAFETAQLRGNFYIPSADGVMAVSSLTDSLRLAGCSVLRLILNALSVDFSGTMLPPAQQFSYRLVLKRRDENGLISRSRPTGALNITNDHPSDTYDPHVYILVRDMQPGESVEVYRTRIFPVSVQTDEEMSLVYEADFSQFTAGFDYHSFDFRDLCQDEARGARLYTSPSQGGMSGANDPPPACSAIESYRGSLFFGNCSSPNRYVYSYNYGDRTGQSSGIGFRNVTVSPFSAGAITVVISSTVGVQRGQHFGHGQFVGGTYITNISGSTLTLSNAALGALGAPGPATIYDAIQIAGTWFTHDNPDAFGAGLQMNLGVLTDGMYGAYRITPPSPGYNATMVVERLTRDETTVEIRATHGDELSPPINEFGEDPDVMSQDIYPNVLTWSEPDQPEHAPVRNYAFVGERTKAILALSATRDALFVIKEDGVWRLSGFNGQWRIDPFDMTTFCILPSSVRRLNNAIYMLSNKGLVRISDEEGVVLLSDQADRSVSNLVRALIDAAQAGNKADGYYHLGELEGAAAMVDARNSEYILLTGRLLPDDAGAALVYNAATNAFTTFDWEPGDQFGQLTPRGCGLTAPDYPTFFKHSGAHVSSYATLTLGGVTYPLVADDIDTFTITSVSPAGVINYAEATDLVAGDIVVQGSSIFLVTAVATSNQCTVNVSYGAPSNGAATVYRAVQCTVRPHGFANPGIVGKAWTNVLAAFSRLTGPVEVDGLFSSAQPLVPEADQLELERFDVPLVGGFFKNHLGTLLRHPIPNDHVRAWLMRAGISWSMAFGQVALEAIVAENRPYVPNRPVANSTGVT